MRYRRDIVSSLVRPDGSRAPTSSSADEDTLAAARLRTAVLDAGLLLALQVTSRLCAVGWRRRQPGPRSSSDSYPPPGFLGKWSCIQYRWSVLLSTIRSVSHRGMFCCLKCSHERRIDLVDVLQAHDHAVGDTLHLGLRYCSLYWNRFISCSSGLVRLVEHLLARVHDVVGVQDPLDLLHYLPAAAHLLGDEFGVAARVVPWQELIEPPCFRVTRIRS